jgi:hypothetical protein
MWTHAVFIVGSFAGVNHGNQPHEWGGLFELGVGDYTWTFHKNSDGVYGANDDDMKAVIFRGFGDSSDAILRTHHNAAEALLRQACLPLLDSATLYPGDSCLDLTFNYSSDETSFHIKIATAGRFVVFTEHYPREFLADALRTPSGFVVGPVATYDYESSAHDHETTAHDHEVDPVAAAALGISLISLPFLCLLLVLKWQETTTAVATPQTTTMELHTDRPVDPTPSRYES